MIEIKNKFHIQRLFATSIGRMDFLKAVYYAGYRGDIIKIPFYYIVTHGNSAISDLTLSIEELLNQMKSNTKNEIRRAVKEGIDFTANVDFEEFVPFYNSFCESKGLDDIVTIPRLLKYDKTIITKTSINGQPLAMHATVVSKEQKLAFLLFSCSQRFDSGVDKKMIGWANRYLHYKDFEFLKSIGVETYDWSGVCIDPNDPRYSIGQFKMSFGGKLIDSPSFYTPMYGMLLLCRNFLIGFKRLLKK